MVSFSCENCGDVLTKKKLDPHRNRCHGASFTCLDCMVHFYGTEYRAHTSCISEAQKYEGALYKQKKPKQQQHASAKAETKAVVARNAYVEDAPDVESGPLAVLDVPPKAPSPPPAVAVNVFDFLVADEGPESSKSMPRPQDSSRTMQETADQKVTLPEPAPMEHHYPDGHAPQDHYAKNGFLYGDAPLQPSFERYDSYASLAVPPPGYEESTYYTPAPKREPQHSKVREKGSTAKKSTDKKRKRQHVEDLDLSSLRPLHPQGDQVMEDAPPMLHHSGLTGGLNRLLSARQDFPLSPDYSGADGAEASPLTPMKRSKHSSKEEGKERDRDRGSRARKAAAAPQTDGDRPHRSRRPRDESEREQDDGEQQHRSHRRRHRRSSSPQSPRRDPGASHKQLRALEYSRAASAEPNGRNAMIVHPESASRAELFMSFVSKGPESERGCSINKALKRYHRERRDRREDVKMEEEKELWRSLRLRKNERGEVVLFF